MELHLIRHGETNWNKERRVQGQSDSHLTDLGTQQAKELGQRIAHREFDEIESSSSLRTRQTAEHAFPESTIEIAYLDELREIFLGPWEGHLYEDLAQSEPESHGHFWEQPHLFRLSGAESFFELQQRAIDAVAEIEAAHRTDSVSGRKVAIVSHGALIKSYLCHVEGRSMDQLWAPPRMHNCAHSIVALNSIDGTSSANILQYADQPSIKE
ncbi:MAG: histidine phosphatase family protein [Gammaproteobacteria bacterium]